MKVSTNMFHWDKEDNLFSQDISSIPEFKVGMPGVFTLDKPI